MSCAGRINDPRPVHCEDYGSALKSEWLPLKGEQLQLFVGPAGVRAEL